MNEEIMLCLRSVKTVSARDKGGAKTRYAGRQLPWKPNGTRRGSLATPIGPA
jgi:hypothetical protein